MRLLAAPFRGRTRACRLIAALLAAALLSPAAAEAAPAWGTTGEAPQTGDSAHTSGAAFKAKIVVLIDKEAQAMRVFVDGFERHRWKVSTGIAAYDTPAGSYPARSMNEIWYSRQWDDAPMPHAIFFTRRGHAIHGTLETRKLGRPASHGCVRLAPENARTLFALVKAEGLTNTAIVLHGALPQTAAAAGGAKKKLARASAGGSAKATPARNKASRLQLKRQARQQAAAEEAAQREAAKRASANEAAKAKKNDRKKTVAPFDPYAVGAPRRLTRKEWRALYGGASPPPPR
ncbi:MAG TPA: L,D-transpeptidase [Methyloceanibacter sp.]|nr:L,D-transpeptidase [Methyloceanibacter sp.]